MKRLTKTLTIAALAISAGIAPISAGAAPASVLAGPNLPNLGPNSSGPDSLYSNSPDGLTWQVYRHLFSNQIDTRITLSRAMPGTELVQFTAGCLLGSGTTSIEASLSTGIGDRSEGQTDQLHYVDGNGTAHVIPVSVSGSALGRGSQGVEITAEITDPFWQTLGAGGVMTYGLPGQEMRSMPLDRAADLVRYMITACGSVADPTGATPSVPAPTVTCDNVLGMASRNNDVPQQMTFTNYTFGLRSLFQIDHTGQPIHMADLGLNSSITFNSFLTHPWMVTDGHGTCLEAMVPQLDQGNQSIG